MDILTVITPTAIAQMDGFKLVDTPEGLVYRAHFAAKRRSGADATKYVELLIGPRTGAKHARMRWRCGYLYNHVAIFWDVPDAHRATWAGFARTVAQRVRDAAIVQADLAYNALSSAAD